MARNLEKGKSNKMEHSSLCLFNKIITAAFTGKFELMAHLQSYSIRDIIKMTKNISSMEFVSSSWPSMNTITFS
jgi:hypothetical protein